MDTSIGERVAQLIPRGQQGVVAAAVRMQQDALSRALRGQRGFGAAELMRIADYFQEDLHFLISGEPDPQRITVVARHDYDQETGARSVPGRRADQSTLDDIALAYRQAPPPNVRAWTPPSDVTATRDQLGHDFVRPFIARLEDCLGIDVIRVAELSTAYSFIIDGRPVIAIPGGGNWFRENWSLAHELAHLVLGHHAAAETFKEHERTAHSFAAELLMPASELRSVDWSELAPGQLAERVWTMGVSTEALANRLQALGIDSPLVQEWKGRTTQKLLRHHWVPSEPGDPITERMDNAAVRRFPVALQTSHLNRIAQGDIDKGTLAWMLGVAVDSLEVEQPAAPAEMSSSELLDALGA